MAAREAEAHREEGRCPGGIETGGLGVGVCVRNLKEQGEAPGGQGSVCEEQRV